MKIYIEISNPDIVRSVTEGLTSCNLDEIVKVPIFADVFIIDSRVRVFDSLNLGKVVVQFIWRKNIQSAEELSYFERFKNRIFVCHTEDEIFDALDTIEETLFGKSDKSAQTKKGEAQ